MSSTPAGFVYVSGNDRTILQIPPLSLSIGKTYLPEHDGFKLSNV